MTYRARTPGRIAIAFPSVRLTGVVTATSQLRRSSGATSGTARTFAASAVTGTPVPPMSTSGIIPTCAAAQTHSEALNGPAFLARETEAIITRAATNENWKLPSKRAAGLIASMKRPATDTPAKESESLPSIAAPKASDAITAARTDETRKPARHITQSATRAAEMYLLRRPTPKSPSRARTSIAAEPTCRPATDTRCDRPQDLRSAIVAGSMSSSLLMVTPSMNPATFSGKAFLNEEAMKSRAPFTVARTGSAPVGTTFSAVRIDSTPCTSIESRPSGSDILPASLMLLPLNRLRAAVESGSLTRALSSTRQRSLAVFTSLTFA
jgi:hypothetical protein